MSPIDHDLIDAPAALPVSPIPTGELVQGKYRIGPLVGFGGMAVVVAAEHLELDQPVAIKLLLLEHASRPDAVRRFLGEARAAARLKSAHVARVLDVGTTATPAGVIVPFMVMELLKGRDLDAILQQRGRLPLAEAVEYVLQACDAVAEAHALGIIHRDLKPSNLFLTTRRDRTPVIKLLDFGISKSAPRAGTQKDIAVTADHHMMGSPGYMSPEQIRTSKEIDLRTDVWSLGIILHELLAGRPPFAAETVADTLVRVLHTAPDDLAQQAPETPERLVAIVSRCLQKDPAARFESVEAFAAALAPFRSTTPILMPASEDTGGGEAGISVATIYDPPRRRIPFATVLVVGAVALALVVIAGLGFARLRGPTAAAAEPSASAPSAPPSADELTAIATPSATPADAPTSEPSAATASTAIASTAIGSAATASSARPMVKPKAAVGKPLPAKPATSGTSHHRTDW